MKKERLYSYLIFIAAIAAFSGGSYILVDIFLRTREIDFTLASNILLGISGLLIILGYYFYRIAKEKEADLFSD